MPWLYPINPAIPPDAEAEQWDCGCWAEFGKVIDPSPNCPRNHYQRDRESDDNS